MNDSAIASLKIALVTTETEHAIVMKYLKGNLAYRYDVAARNSFSVLREAIREAEGTQP